MPNDELPPAAELQNHRRAIAGLWSVERSPMLDPSLLIKTDNHRAVRPARQYYQLVAIDKRRPGHAPRRQLRSKIPGQILLPDDAPTRGLETKQMANGAQRIH